MLSNFQLFAYLQIKKLYHNIVKWFFQPKIDEGIDFEACLKHRNLTT